MEQEITYKKCSKCGEKKPLTEEYFTKRKDTNFGWRRQCIICWKKQNRKSQKNWRVDNKETTNKIGKKSYYKRREKILKDKKIKYYQGDRVKQIKYKTERFKNDKLYKISHNIKSLMRTGFKRKGWGKKTKTQDYLKCDYETFKKHIENQFTDGMTWDNHGEWHYDHYYPISLAQTEEDMYIFNHYTNYQPLWAKDNLSKKDKVPDGFEEWYEMMKKKVL